MGLCAAANRTLRSLRTLRLKKGLNHKGRKEPADKSSQSPAIHRARSGNSGESNPDAGSVCSALKFSRQGSIRNKYLSRLRSLPRVPLSRNACFVPPLDGYEEAGGSVKPISIAIGPKSVCKGMEIGRHLSGNRNSASLP